MMASLYYCDQNPSGFCFLVQISAFVNLDLAGITEFKCERKNEKNSDRSSKRTPSCKWPIGVIYRPPSENTLEFIEKVNEIISGITKGNKHCCFNKLCKYFTNKT